MIILRRGDRLPTVAVAQMLINRYADSYIRVDGIFGRETQRAVRAFQTSDPSGQIRNATWRALNRPRYQILDSVDATDPDILDHQDISGQGGDPIVNYGMSSGAPQVVDRVLAQGQIGNVVLLRFHGHGSPGHMIVASGVTDSGSAFVDRYGPGFYRYLERLRPLFLPFGSVELNGCRVGRGIRGRNLLQGMANALGVPVTAGIQSQYGGGNSTFRFEGPTRTICPYGQSLRDWARSNCRVTLL
ncbi:MAG: peptidoglycan-binding domain-containing protein [Bacteroidota bacterium]